MDEIIRTLASNRLYLIGVALIASIIIYVLLKKIIKLMVIILIAAAIYLAVLHNTGSKLPERIEKIKTNELNGSGGIKRLKDNIANIILGTENGTQSSASSSENR